ncbi:MAG: C39 family peptidase [Chloroflexi bacterium]|nr:C39 family peptidase [Chloroflexota bacterium]
MPTATATLNAVRTAVVPEQPPAVPAPPPRSNALPVSAAALAPPSRQADGYTMLLDIPFRSQFDDSPYAAANCGPASLAMVLEAFGIQAPTERLRAIVNRLQGTSGYNDGVALDFLQVIAEESGLAASGLRDQTGYHRWTVDEIRAQIARGWPVITLVHYRSLPGNEGSRSVSDHYVVVVGANREGVFVHDPAFADAQGARRFIADAQLRQAWADSSIPQQAAAIGPGPNQLPLATAQLLDSEIGAGSAVGSGSSAAPNRTVQRAPEPSPTSSPSLPPPAPVDAAAVSIPSSPAARPLSPSRAVEQTAALSRAVPASPSRWSRPTPLPTIAAADLSALVAPGPTSQTTTTLVLADRATAAERSPIPLVVVVIVVAVGAVVALRQRPARQW